MKELADETLWALAREDEAAFVTLYRRHARPLLGFCVRRLGDPELAAEVCAEVFAALVVAVRGRGRTPASVSGWLYGTARNKVSDAIRRGRVDAQARTRLAIGPIALTDAGIEGVLAADDDVRVALHSLPPDQREAVALRVLADESYDTIAAAQGTTPANARQRVTRGLARMRGTLEDSDER